MGDKTILNTKAEMIQEVISAFDFESNWTTETLKAVLSERLGEVPAINFTWPKVISEGQSKDRPSSVTVFFTDGTSEGASKVTIIP